MDMNLCPVCHSPIPSDPRYPKAVCTLCMGKAVDPEGRKVGFFNTGLDGGLSGMYEDDGSEYGSTLCLIDGLVCHVEERHMGGIVIQVSK